MARLRDDQSPESATAALRARQSVIRQVAMPRFTRPDARDAFLHDPITVRAAPSGPSYARQRHTPAVLTLLGLSGLFLLLACGHVAQVHLARTVARRHELGVRLALGASGPRLARQLFVEAIVLAGLGSVGALLVAHWGSRLLVRMFAASVAPLSLNVGLNWHVMLFTFVLGLVSAVAFGVASALRTLRSTPMEALAASATGAQPAASPASHHDCTDRVRHGGHRDVRAVGTQLRGADHRAARFPAGPRTCCPPEPGPKRDRTTRVGITVRTSRGGRGRGPWGRKCGRVDDRAARGIGLDRWHRDTSRTQHAWRRHCESSFRASVPSGCSAWRRMASRSAAGSWRLGLLLARPARVSASWF